jgi:hypothetical protein
MTVNADSADSIARLAVRRAAVRDSFRSALTAEQTISHRRLLNAGRLAQARAVIEQAERLFLAAHDALAHMNECELEAFERVMALGYAAGLHQVVAAVLLRSDREARHRRISSKADGSFSSREASMAPE